jgi:peptidyl-dipeptidase A
MTEQATGRFVEETVSELKPLAVSTALADWDASTQGTPEALASAAKSETELRLFLSSASRHKTTADLLKSNAVDPLTRRQLTLLYLEQRPNQLSEEVIDDLVQRSKEIQSEFFTFRAELDGRQVTNNQILDVLRTELDESRRRAAWDASKQIGPRVAPRLLALVERRNESARSLGYRDYYRMQLELQEIDEDELSAVFDDLKRRTDLPFREAKAYVDECLAERYGTSPDALRPWHYEDPFFQEPPLAEKLGLGELFRRRDVLDIADRFYEGIGLPLTDVLQRSDLYERDGKDQHAYCTNINRESDVRILCNLKADERWMGILLHELGHAAFEKYFPDSLPWLLRQPAHIASTEAIAMFMDRLVYDVDWLEKAAGMSLPDREKMRSALSRHLRFESLLIARWVLVMTMFERELYANPWRDDLNMYWWELVEELQLVPRLEDRSEPDWAAKIHFTIAPVYYHNYLLGELMASQLGAALRREVLNSDEPRGYVGRRDVGAFLRERWFAPGASVHWQDLLEGATGSRLSPGPFVDEFVSE